MTGERVDPEHARQLNRARWDELAAIHGQDGGAQNDSAAVSPLERVALNPEPLDAGEWWYATHRRRLLGRLAEVIDQRDSVGERPPLHAPAPST